MRKFTFFYIICAIFLLPSGLFAQSRGFKGFQTGQPLHEIRAVWLATIGGIDWPHSYARYGNGEKTQQKELCTILDQLVDAGINTVMLQCRIRGTVIYPSAMEPWDGCLSGKPGESPGYDALEFAVRECHKRGMKVHAWMVTIPVGSWQGAGCVNLRNTHPELLKKIGDDGFLDPEKSGVADYIASLCREVAVRYDIDGVHLDYIRYPETWGKISNKAKARENITRIVKAASVAVKSVKPWVAMSCSPVGKYADTKRAWAHGWNARDIVCQDAVRWLEEGSMDALFPMMYFKDKNFYPFLVDWQERSCGKLVVPGLGIYFMHPAEKDWALSDITREMMVSRQLGMGICMFRSKFLTDNTKGIYDYTKTLYSVHPVLQPAMTWLDNIPPMAPKEMVTEIMQGGGLMLRWKPSGHTNTDGGILYNVYGSTDDAVDTQKPENILAVNYDGCSIEIPHSNIKSFAVTAVDRYGNESAPVTVRVGNVNDVDDGKTGSCAQLFCDGKKLCLDGSDVSEGQLIEYQSFVGTSLTSRFATRKDGKLMADISGLQIGHYKVYVINIKGHRHLLGTFSVNPW